MLFGVHRHFSLQLLEKYLECRLWRMIGPAIYLHAVSNLFHYAVLDCWLTSFVGLLGRGVGEQIIERICPLRTLKWSYDQTISIQYRNSIYTLLYSYKFDKKKDKSTESINLFSEYPVCLFWRIWSVPTAFDFSFEIHAHKSFTLTSKQPSLSVQWRQNKKDIVDYWIFITFGDVSILIFIK